MLTHTQHSANTHAHTHTHTHTVATYSHIVDCCITNSLTAEMLVCYGSRSREVIVNHMVKRCCDNKLFRIYLQHCCASDHLLISDQVTGIVSCKCSQEITISLYAVDILSLLRICLLSEYVLYSSIDAGVRLHWCRVIFEC